MAEWVRAPAYNLREQGVAGSILGQVKFLFLTQIFYLAPQWLSRKNWQNSVKNWTKSAENGQNWRPAQARGLEK